MPGGFRGGRQRLAGSGFRAFVLCLLLGPPAPALSADPQFPALQPARGLADPTLAYGLGGVVDYNPIVPFLDVVKTMRPWMASLPDQWLGVSAAEMAERGLLDDNGWPTAVPEGTVGVTGSFSWEHNGLDLPDVRAGRYVMQYEGRGTLELFNVAVKSRSPGRIVFDVHAYPDAWWFTITETDPDGTGDHIRNVQVVREEHLELFEAGAMFNPDWLALVEDARQVRFMDWQATNGSTDVSWGDMTRPQYYSWSAEAGYEVPLQVQVRLANEIGADPWFTIPHGADDDYVRRFATYVRDYLDPRLKAHVEFTNEAWNWVFPQTRALVDRGQALWGNGQVGVYYVKRATEVMRIWDQVFGASADARLVKVLAGQTDNTWLAGILLGGELWRQLDPRGYVPPSETFDAFAVTSYFGFGLMEDATLRQRLLRMDRAAAFPIMRDRLLDAAVPQSIPRLARALAEQKKLANRSGLDLILYEGGQHLHHADGHTNDPDYNALMIQFVRSDEMARLYSELWNRWAGLGQGPFMQFVATGRPSMFGSWGLRLHHLDNPPRALLLDRLNAAGTGAWWGGSGGDRYRHGLTIRSAGGGRALAGSAAADLLIGGAGDDVIYPGPGFDRVSGGDGFDTVMLRGSRSDYRIEQAGAEIRVFGPEGTDVLRGVERLVLEDGGSISLPEAAGNGE